MSFLSSAQKAVDIFEKLLGKYDRLLTTVLRFQKLDDKLETLELIKLIVDVLFINVEIDELIFVTELLMSVMLVLKEPFVIRIDETVFETDISEEVTRANVLEILVTLAFRLRQFSETFMQQELMKLNEVFNAFIFGIIVLFKFCSKEEVLTETLFIDKFTVNTSPERKDALVLTFPNHTFSVSMVPDKFENEDEREE